MSEHEESPKVIDANEVVVTAEPSNESADEYEQHCILFPTYATKHSLDDKAELTDHWNIRIRGWAFSTPKTSKTRSLFLGLTSHLSNIQKMDMQSRTSLFWASNIDHKEIITKVIGLTESNKMVVEGDPNEPSVEQLTHEHSAEEAKEDVKNLIDNAQMKIATPHPEEETPSVKIMPVAGSCLGEIAIPQLTVKKWLHLDDNIPFLTGILNSFFKKKDDSKRVRLLRIAAYQDSSPLPTYGVVDLVEPEGFSVISDIDDTIKDTEILSNTRTILSNTFLQPTKEVEGMAPVYHEWYDKDVSFHYVSNSPWQLFPMLRTFFNTYHFPPGSAHLKFYDGIVKSVREQKEHPMASKLTYIGELLKDFPQRKFILIGDTGELDPEIYTKIARENEGRILRIFVRDVSTVHLKGLPPQPAHHSYAQTFTSTYRSLHNYYMTVSGGGEAQSKESQEAATAEVTEIKKEVTSEATPEVPPEAAVVEEQHKSLTSRLMSHISSIHNSLGLEEHSDKQEKEGEEVLKTPLEQFHYRLESLSKGLPEGLFSTFTDPNELRNDPVIRKALKYD